MKLTSATSPFKGKWATSWELTTKVYGDLPFQVKLSAQGNVAGQLRALAMRGLVESSWPDSWKAI